MKKMKIYVYYSIMRFSFIIIFTMHSTNASRGGPGVIHWLPPVYDQEMRTSESPDMFAVTKYWRNPYGSTERYTDGISDIWRS